MREDIKDILFNLIRYKTYYPNYDCIDDCFNYVKELFKDSNLYVKEFCFNNDKMLYVSNSLDKDIDILFVGHIDVVYAKDSDFIPLYKDGMVLGRGSFDMKGHDAVMISLLKNNSFKGKIGLLLTSDEERGGFNGTKLFLEKCGYRSSIAIIPDALNNFSVVDEEKGVLQLEVTINGNSAHSSMLCDGNNAIIEAFGLYNYVTSIYSNPSNSNEYKTSINLGKIMGGDSINRVADKCVCYYDIRYTISDSIDDIINCFKSYSDNISVSIIAIGEAFMTYKDNKYYKMFIDNLENMLGSCVCYSKCNSASDGRFFYKYGIPCVLMNSRGGNIHTDNEYVELDSLYMLYNIYLKYVKEYEKYL